MSGTSMDGVDISLINTNGEKIIRLDKNFYSNYQLSTKLVLEKAQKQPLTKQSIDTINEIITKEYIRALIYLTLFQ